MSRSQIPAPIRSRPRQRPTAAGHRPLVLALAMATGFAGAAANAQPTGAQAIHGSATLSQQGSTLLVTTRNGVGTSHSAINWQSFNVPNGTTTHFAQPGVTSTSINRVLGPDPSAIFGTLSSNGRLVLVNPAGIAVGAGAVVDTAGFTASTLRMSDADAIAGRLRFGDGSAAGPLRVDGQVLARTGDVVLIGPDVQAGAQAVIQSPEGATVLAAGQKVELTGRGLEGIRFEVQAPGDQALNLGTLRGDAVGVFAGTLRHSGLVQAQAATVEGGRVVLKASDHAEAAGSTQAQGLGGAGGQVDVLGRTVGVMAGATIDTSNTNGGGLIRVGGDIRGGNPDLPNAQVTYVAADAQLRANATGRGDGGTVIVWADDTTRAYGRIEARGGANGGDGGFVETSGKRYLDVNGARVDASAAAGQAGQWLLDPSNITIRAGSPDSNISGAPTFAPSTSADSVISDQTLVGAINGGSSVTVTTLGSFGTGAGDIVFDTTNGQLTILKSGAGTTDLTLQADGQIRFTGPSQTHFLVDVPDTAPSAGTLNLRLEAAGGVRTDSGAQVQFSTAGYSTNRNRLTAVLPAGKTWQNDGGVTLNLNSLLSMDGATFSNGSLGILDGWAGPNGGIGGAGALGTFNNAGQVSLSEGAFRVAHLTNTGSFDLYNNTDLEVTRSFATTGSFGFNGRNLRVVQQSGPLDLGTGSGLWASGAIELAALSGDLLVDRDLWGASANLSAAGNLRFTYVDASGDGSMRMSGGPVNITAGGSISGGSVDSYGAGWGESAPGAGGNISISATGDIALSGSIYAEGGGAGSFGTAAASGGTVSLQSTAGSVSVAGSIGAYGGSGGDGIAAPGGQGGTVRVRAAGDVNLNYIDVAGGYAWTSGSAGGRGGVVDIEGGRLNLMDIYAEGGSGGSGGNAAGGAGGAGGDVRLVQRTGQFDLTQTWVDAEGGGGGDSSVLGGAGGAGGRIQVVAQGGGVQMTSGYDSLHARGGAGGYTDGTGAGARGGQGGQGGSIQVSAAASSTLLAQLDASGGEGGYAGGTGLGGQGGNGGAVQIALSGAASALTLAGDFHAGAGAAGEAFDDFTYAIDPARSGSMGDAWGSFRAFAPAGIVVPSSMPYAEPSPTEGPMAVQLVTTQSVPAELRIDAQWTNDGAVTVASGARVMTTQSLVNNGSLHLAGGSSVELGHYDHYSETFTAGGVALVNGAGGTVTGSGTIAGDLVNAGTVAPGGTGAIGALRVAGNYTQQSTGVLLMDIAANPLPYQPGVTYDQLAVQGNATLDGQLQLASIAAVAAPSSSLLVAGATQLVSASTAPTDAYELISAASASGQFSLISGPPELVSQIRMNVGGTLVPVPGFTAAPSTSSPIGEGLVAAIQEVLPGVSLEQIQQVVTESQNNAIATLPQDEDEGQPEGSADIVVTDSACKPG